MENFLVDTHSHIDMADFEDDFQSVIDRANEANVKRIIIPSVDANSFDEIIKRSENSPEIFGALGIHPSEAQNSKEEDFKRIIELASNQNKIVAIGECGLDYYWDKTFVNEQKKVFIRQIEIANSLNLPIIVHDREAHKDTFDILTKNAKTPIVMHCFSGSIEFAQECIKKGFYIGLGGVVTFKNAKKAHEVAKEIPLEFLLLETDAPYLTPEPFRGKRNEPSYVKFVAEHIAKLRNCSYNEIATTTTKNARKIFGI